MSKSSSTSSSRIETDKTGVPYDERSSSQSNMSDAIGSYSSNSIRSWIIDSPQAIVNPQDEESPTAASRKRRMEPEEDSYDPLWLQQPQEELQVDRMQEILSSIDSSTNSPTNPQRRRKKRRRHREDDRIS